jgi:hypothetical protein
VNEVRRLEWILLFGTDKWQHFIVYAIAAFGLSIFVCLIPPWQNGIKKIIAVWFGLNIIGLLEEYRQLWLPIRTAEWMDAAANIVGTTAGVSVPLLLCVIWRAFQDKPIYSKKSMMTCLALLVFFIGPLFYGLVLWNEDIPITKVE